MSVLSLPLVGEAPPEVPLYQGDLEADAARMNRCRAEDLGGKLSYPSKMDCPAWGIPARYCHTGSILRRVPGSTCADCYAFEGTFRFKNVDKVLEDNYRKLFNVLWTPALLSQIRWEANDRFRWMLAGDLQNRAMLLDIIQICNATKHLLHWLPTREIRILLSCADLIPANLTIRYSAPMVDGPPPKAWPLTSTVVSVATDDACPASVKGGSCADHDCTRCWNPEVPNIPYLQH